MFFYNLYGVFLILFPSIKIQYHEYRRREEVWHWTFHSIFKFKIWKWKDAEVAYFRILISKNAIQQYIFRAWNYCWQRQYLKQSTFETKNLLMFNIYSILLQYSLVVDGECHYKPGHFPAALPAAWRILLHIPPCQCQGVLVIILGLQLYMLAMR